MRLAAEREVDIISADGEVDCSILATAGTVLELASSKKL